MNTPEPPLEKLMLLAPPLLLLYMSLAEEGRAGWSLWDDDWSDDVCRSCCCC